MAIPGHVGIIPDGNRRWARLNNIPLTEAYEKGYRVLKDTINRLHKLGVVNISVYAMSRDNCLKRSRLEKGILEGLAVRALQELRSNEELERNGVRVIVVGDLALLPQSVRREAMETMKATSNRNGGFLAIALCYSGRWEIDYYTSRGLKPPTLGLEPIDLLIRTGGYRRISSFFPLLLEYAEMYFTDTLWPDFSEEELHRSIEWFGRQQRKFGK